MTKLEVAELLGLIPDKLLEQISAKTNVNWNVSRLRGEVMLDLLLFGMLRSDRVSTHVLEHLYNSSFFDFFSSKNKGHQTRHSSIAERLTQIPSEYFEQIFNWAWQHFAGQINASKKLSRINRFDSTMIQISSALVNWGMRVGRPPKDGYQKHQLKITLGMKGLLPTSVKVFFDQEHLAEEKALYEAIRSANPKKDEWVVFDRGMSSRKRFQSLDLTNIKFVTRGNENCRYQQLRPHEESVSKLNNDQIRFIQDSIVYLYADGDQVVEHEFRLVELEILKSGKRLFFITNIFDLQADQISKIYRARWDIEVFFKFLKQELSIKHLLSHSENGVRVQVYVALLLAILLTVFKNVNKLASYKITKMKFHDDLLFHIYKQLVNFKDDS